MVKPAGQWVLQGGTEARTWEAVPDGRQMVRGTETQGHCPSQTAICEEAESTISTQALRGVYYFSPSAEMVVSAKPIAGHLVNAAERSRLALQGRAPC